MNARYPAIAERATYRCEYCHAPESIFNFPFEIEHIYPQARGGSDDLDNLALSCRACNLFKSDFETGQPYNNTYCYVIQLENGRSIRGTAYFDTELVRSIW